MSTTVITDAYETATRWTHIKRFLVAWMAILLAYGVYRVIAVPWIEPSVKRRHLVTSGDQQQRPSLPPKYAALFEKDQWERQRPKVLATNQATLLFQDHVPRADGRIELRPCTVILNNDNGDQERPVVLRAPQGAVLKFDQAFDLTKASLGKFVNGQLEGKITIHSPPSKPGKDDEFYAETRDVRIQPHRVWTNSPVSFRFGRSHGSGRQLLISLNESGKSQLGIGSPQTLELVHVDQVVVDVPAKKLTSPGRTVTTNEKAKTTTAVITCSGRFKFDFERFVGTLEDDVRVVHQATANVVDRLWADQLEIHVRDPEKKKRPADDEEGKSIGLDGVVAIGRPAKLEAPSNQVSAVAARIQYDWAERTVRVEDPAMARLRFQRHSVEAPYLEYQMASDDHSRIGLLTATGPGTYQGRMKKSNQWITATWKQNVVVQPQDGEHVLSMTGAADLTVGESGHFRADQLHLWMKEELQEKAKPTDKDRHRLVPTRLRATGNIEFASEQLSGRTQLLEAWFEFLPQAAANPNAAQQPSALSRFNQSFQDSPGQTAGNTPATKKKRHVQVAAELIRIQLAFAGKEARVREAHLTGNVSLFEIPPPGRAKGFQLTGQNVTLVETQPNLHHFTAAGTPARVDVRGMLMEGSSIQLMQENNRLWMDGPGRMVLPPSPPQPGKPTVSSPVEISWQNGFEFDGQVANFSNQVLAVVAQRMKTGDLATSRLSGNKMVVKLNQAVDFQQPQRPDQVEVRELIFPGKVVIDNATQDARNMPSSREKLFVTDLVMEHATGTFYSNGPGHGFSTRFNRNLKLNPLGAAVAPGPEGAARKPQLVYLYVEFQRGISGDIRQREVRFHQDVRSVYGPVRSWEEQLDPHRPDLLGPQGVSLTCQEVSVAQTPGTEEQLVELRAVGDVRVQGESFSAMGHRMSFSQAKDLLTLAGDGRAKARIRYNLYADQPPSHASAGTLKYSPGTGMLHSTDISEVEIFGGQGSPRRPGDQGNQRIPNPRIFQ